MTVFDVCMINDEFVPISIFNTLSTFISHIQLNLFIFNGVMSSQKTQIGYCSSNICVWIFVMDIFQIQSSNAVEILLLFVFNWVFTF